MYTVSKRERERESKAMLVCACVCAYLGMYVFLCIRSLSKSPQAREAARKAKVAKEAQAALAATQSCTDLVQVDWSAIYLLY